MKLVRNRTNFKLRTFARVSRTHLCVGRRRTYKGLPEHFDSFAHRTHLELSSVVIRYVNISNYSHQQADSGACQHHHAMRERCTSLCFYIDSYPPVTSLIARNQTRRDLQRDRKLRRRSEDRITCGWPSLVVLIANGGEWFEVAVDQQSVCPFDVDQRWCWVTVSLLCAETHDITDPLIEQFRRHDHPVSLTVICNKLKDSCACHLLRVSVLCIGNYNLIMRKLIILALCTKLCP